MLSSKVLKKLIDETKEVYKQSTVLRNRLEKNIVELERNAPKFVQDRLKEEFPDVTFRTVSMFSSGANSNNWKPGVMITSFWYAKDNSADFYGDGWYIHKKGSSYQSYKHNKTKINPPFDHKDLLKILKSLSSELAVDVFIYEKKFEDYRAEENFKTTDDLRVLYPDAEVLLDGKIWSMGWDIADNYAILKMEDGIHIFYSTNGHGLGYDVEVLPGDKEGVGNFCCVVNLEDINKVKKVLEKYK